MQSPIELPGQAVGQLNSPVQPANMGGESSALSLQDVAHRLQVVHQGEFKKIIPLRVRILQTQFKHGLREFIGNVLDEGGMPGDGN